jgi:hypothetical protein
MRYVIVVLAVAGIVVSFLALAAHYAALCNQSISCTQIGTPHM